MAEFRGRFFDGKTAAARDVAVTISINRLAIRTGDIVVERWAGSDIRIIEGGRDDPVVRLTHADNDAARLIVTDADFRGVLLHHCPDLRQEARSGPVTLRRVAAWGAGLAAVAAIAVATVQYLPALGAALIPLGWEERAGRQTVDQVLALLTMGKKGSGACTEGAGRAALDGLVAKLSAGISSPYRFRVTVADISVPNAFAASGGYVVLFHGLFKLAETPDAVAGVLAHEFAHVIHRHPTEGVVRAAGLSILIDLLTGSMAGGDVIAGAGKMLIGASYSRGAEAEADATAVEILTRAGISTAGLEAFFRQLAAQEESDKPKGRLGEMLQVIASHPRSAARASAVAGSQGIATKPALTKRDWQALQAICDSD